MAPRRRVDGFGWTGGARSAVSLTFDDGVQSQLDDAARILDRYGIRGTFYVNPTRAFAAAAPAWRTLAARGHEVGNHTLTHPCGGNYPFVADEHALERLSLAAIERDVVAAQERLVELLPGHRPVTFAYPCGQTFVGRGVDQRSYVPIIARRFSAARGLGETPNDPRRCDLHCLSAWVVREGTTAAELAAMLETGRARGQWSIYCFHGVGGDHYRVETTAFERFVADLADRDDVWVETVRAVAAQVAAARSTPTDR